MAVWVGVLLVLVLGGVGSSWGAGVGRVTYYTSYAQCCTDPSADQTECRDFNACQWAGYFACINGKMSPEWVASNDIVALYDDSDPNGVRFKETYCNRFVRLRKRHSVTNVVVEFVAKVVDTCGNSDCNYCCKRNSLNGMLIDIEENTAIRHFGSVAEVSWGEIEYEFVSGGGPSPPSPAPTPRPPAPTPRPPSPPSGCPPGGVAVWGDCHGRTTCCEVGTVCVWKSQWYSQCIPGPSTPSPPLPCPSGGIAVWGDCHRRTTCCEEGTVCVWQSQWYSQCKPK